MTITQQGLTPEPVEVELEAAARTLRIGWSDGHQSHYPLSYLRGFCPCAHCQGHGGGWEYVANSSPDLTEIGEVGNYALSFTFADGHRTGIYSFEVLRQLCPCESCQAQQGSRHPKARMPHADASS